MNGNPRSDRDREAFQMCSAFTEEDRQDREDLLRLLSLNQSIDNLIKGRRITRSYLEPTRSRVDLDRGYPIPLRRQSLAQSSLLEQLERTFLGCFRYQYSYYGSS